MRECNVSMYLEDRSASVPGELEFEIAEGRVVALKSIPGVGAFSGLGLAVLAGGTMLSTGRCTAGSPSWGSTSSLRCPKIDGVRYAGLSNQRADGVWASKAESAWRRRRRQRKSRRPEMINTSRHGIRIAKIMPTRGLSDAIAETTEDGEGSADTGIILYVTDEVGSAANVLAFEFCDKLEAVENVFESTETVDCAS